MDEIKDILKKTAEYVAIVQPELEKSAALLEKHAEAIQVFVKKAQGVVAVLVHRNIIDEHKKQAMLEKLAADHSYALDVLEKLAGIVGADQMGNPSYITKESEDKADPFEREFMPGLINNKKSNLL